MHASASSPRSRRLRLLFVAEAVTLAHVARPVALASAAAAAGHDICLACDPRYNPLLGGLPFPARPLASLSSERFFQALARGRPLYDAATLTDYVEADRALIRQFRPDAVVGDFRLSLGISARLESVPYLNITNAYWSPCAQLRFPVPDIPPVQLLGPGLAQRLFDLVRPLVFALHARPLNQVRRRYGLSPLPADLRHGYTEADRVLYADLPELVPLRDLPAHHRFLGPIEWSPRVPLPPWWDTLTDARPIIYVTLGSSGQARRLPDILAALADVPVTVMAASAGHALPGTVPDNARVASYLPGQQAAARASLVICNGGSPTSYQALAAGRPVIGLAGNLDQYLNMSLVQATGAGLLLRAARTGRSAIRQGVSAVLEDAGMRLRAQELSRAMARCDAVEAFLDVLDGLSV